MRAQTAKFSTVLWGTFEKKLDGKSLVHLGYSWNRALLDHFSLIFSGAEPLENAHKTTTVVFDKTGTITHGRPTVSFLGLVSQQQQHEIMPLCRLLAVLGAAENGSEHPLAKAIVSFVKATMSLESITARVSNFRAVPGCGLSVNVSQLDEMEVKGEQSKEIKQFYASLHQPMGNAISKY